MNGLNPFNQTLTPASPATSAVEGAERFRFAVPFARSEAYRVFEFRKRRDGIAEVVAPGRGEHPGFLRHQCEDAKQNNRNAAGERFVGGHRAGLRQYEV